VTLKGQKITRPSYRALYEAECEKVKREHAADTRHRRLMVAFGTLDVVLAATMLYLLAR
jgi:hypothetical protein